MAKVVTFMEAAEAYRHRLHVEGRLNIDTERRIEEFVNLFKNRDICTINGVDVHEYRSGLLADGRSKNPSTIARNLNVLAAILNNAKYIGLVKDVIRVRRPKVSDMRTFHLELDEIPKIIEYVRVHYSPLSAFSLLLMIDTGARFGEAMNMRWCDIGSDWIRICERQTTGTRSKTKPRLVPTSPRLLRFMQQHGIVPDPTLDKPTDAILFSRFGWGATVISRHLKAALRQAAAENGVSNSSKLRLHDLRHTFAYLCGSAGADLADIKDLMGHDNINVTLRYRGFIKARAREIIKKGME